MSTDHASLADKFNKDEQRVDWHDETLWWIRQKRDRAADTLPEWEQLRETASEIKNNVLSQLSEYLVEFEANAQRNGATVHWAKDDREHNEIVYSIIAKQGAKKVVKSKSMLTEECHLNEFLYEKGVEVIDTDLGERIVQLAGEPPSHIVLPCIHWKKEEIGALFHKHLGTPKGNADPDLLTAAARMHLRKKFLVADVAITGVNFAVASTGEFVVCTNEGNADMGVHLANVHIASMGIEKIIPKREHLGVFLRLLARSATGQPITTYSSHFKNPRKGQQVHIVIVDNGRSRQLGREDFRSSLKCIRCAACFNTCPVYRRSGGHSYHNAIAGPLGSILAPNLDMKEYADLPFASTLCGSCTHVCPVKIDIHNQLYKWRQVIIEKGYRSVSKSIETKLLATVLSSPSLTSFAGNAARWTMRNLPLLVNNRFNPWYKQRDLPNAPRQSFHQWYRANRTGAAPSKVIERVSPKSAVLLTAHPVNSIALKHPNPILSAIASNQPPKADLPQIPSFPHASTNLHTQFELTLKSLGGQSHHVSSHDDIIDILKTKFPNIRRAVSTLPGFISYADAAGLAERPHTFSDVDLAIVRGHFAVAENGAVWITDDLMQERALPFIAEHLVVVIAQDQIVATMHDAYERIGSAAYSFGTFIAGPSKTADIEQSLVLGAHGAKSMTVFLTDVFL